MNFDPRTEAQREQEEEEARRREEFEDLMVALKVLLRQGQKRAAILLINKCYPDD
jgi:hypothetical protein